MAPAKRGRNDSDKTSDKSNTSTASDVLSGKKAGGSSVNPKRKTAGKNTAGSSAVHLLAMMVATVIPFLGGFFLSSALMAGSASSADSSGMLSSSASRRLTVDDAAMVEGFAETKLALDSIFTSSPEDGRPAVDLDSDSPENPFAGINLVIHRNGESSPCASSASREDEDEQASETEADSEDVDIYHSLLEAAFGLELGHSLEQFDKYDVDALLTTALAHFILWREEDAHDQCRPELEPKNGKVRLSRLPRSAPPLLHFCDMGAERTPVLPDHNSLVPIPTDFTEQNGQTSLPCHFHTREGLRITSLPQLADYARSLKQTTCDATTATEDAHHASSDQKCSALTTLRLHAVPAGRVFMFAPSFVGEIFELPHVQVPSGLPVSLKVLSLEPRVFDIFNFFDKEESDSIVTKALAETSESHRIKRSSTGSSGYNINSRRTSENGFDTHGKTAMDVKRRCFEVLGFDTYIESFADGLQVLRYNLTTAYVPHLDWIDDPSRREEHNFDSSGVGSNRFSTILLYMSDLGDQDGGETVFAKGWPADLPEEERLSEQEALTALRASDEGNVLKEGSWEETMAAKCRSRLSIRPNSARAVLFYSQHPGGEPDQSSLHGGCPVLRGSKWAANLWTWNAPRNGYPGSPVNQDVVDRNRKNNKGAEEPQAGPEQLKATFSNSGKDPAFAKADLYFQETFWGPLGHGDPQLGVNTYEGHVWNVMVDKKVVKTWTISKDKVQYFEV